jgi:ribulose-phosphate 3-epimerase
MLRLSASILSADFLNLQQDIARMEKGGCDVLHIDITDGHFVPNLTMGICVAEAACKATSMRKDVHLMISRPQDFIKKFSDAGADMIFFHAEATAHPFEMIKYIRECGKLVGVALDPGTRVQSIAHYLHAVDAVLVVAVCVGFGGQSYIEEMDAKVKELVRLRSEKGFSFEIQVDGGLTADNARAKHDIGVDTLVAGSMFFQSPDVRGLVSQIKCQSPI